MRRTYGLLVMIGALGGPVACGDAGGDMNPPQESVSDGQFPLAIEVAIAVEAGSGVFGLTSADGWTIEYTRFLVTFGGIEFTRADGSSVAHEELSIIDVLAVGSRQQLATVVLDEGATEVSFSMPAANGQFTPIAPATTDDRDGMAKGGYSVYVEGTISQTGGLACVPGSPTLCTPAPIVAFKLGAPIDAMFEGCPPLDVAPDEDADQTLMLAGDLWFRTDFNSSGAAAPLLRAQWLANADTNRDGEATIEELAKIEASALFDAELGYDTRTGAPFAIETAADFFAAQARMIGRDALGGCSAQSSL
jgi:hypothetical protein